MCSCACAILAEMRVVRALLRVDQNSLFATFRLSHLKRAAYGTHTYISFSIYFGWSNKVDLQKNWCKLVVLPRSPSLIVSCQHLMFALCRLLRRLSQRVIFAPGHLGVCSTHLVRGVIIGLDWRVISVFSMAGDIRFLYGALYAEVELRRNLWPTYLLCSTTAMHWCKICIRCWQCTMWYDGSGNSSEHSNGRFCSVTSVYSSSTPLQWAAL